ncbi:MAG: hypothetical protein ACWIPH_01885, partial [Ostreibacterium sp.]
DDGKVSADSQFTLVGDSDSEASLPVSGSVTTQPSSDSIQGVSRANGHELSDTTDRVLDSGTALFSEESEEDDGKVSADSQFTLVGDSDGEASLPVSGSVTTQPSSDSIQGVSRANGHELSDTTDRVLDSASTILLSKGDSEASSPVSGSVTVQLLSDSVQGTSRANGHELSDTADGVLGSVGTVLLHDNNELSDTADRVLGSVGTTLLHDNADASDKTDLMAEFISDLSDHTALNSSENSIDEVQDANVMSGDDSDKASADAQFTLVDNSDNEVSPSSSDNSQFELLPADSEGIEEVSNSVQGVSRVNGNELIDMADRDLDSNATPLSSNASKVPISDNQGKGIDDSTIFPTPASTKDYSGIAGDVHNQIETIKRQVIPSQVATSDFNHEQLISSLYDLEASLDPEEISPWVWETLATLESTVNSMQNRGLSPSPTDYQKITNALEAIEFSEKVDSSRTKKINNDLMGIRANLSPRQAHAEQASQFAKKIATNNIEATESSVADWQESGYEPGAYLSGLIQQIEDIKADADVSEYEEASTLASRVKDLLQRVLEEDVIPFDPIVDTVQEAIKKITAAEAQRHGEFIDNTKLLSELDDYINAPIIGSKYTLDVASQINETTQAQDDARRSDKHTEKHSNLVDYQTFISRADKFIEASDLYFKDWKKAEFTHQEPLESLLKNINKITDISADYHFESALALGRAVSQILARLYKESLSPNDLTADFLNQSIDELKRVEEAIVEDSDKKEVNPELI